MGVWKSRLSRAAVCSAALAWNGLGGLLVAVGFAGATTLLGWAATGLLFLGATVIGWLLATRPAPVEGGRRLSHRVAMGLVAGVLSFSAIGLLSLLGAAAVAFLPVLVLAHPEVHDSLRTRGRARGWWDAGHALSSGPDTALPASSGRPTPLPEEPAFTVPDTVSDDDLCEAWCSSYVALKRAQDGAARLRAVEVRALYLDDLERRLGDDFTRWLGSAPRAGDDPRRFLEVRDRPA